MKKKQKYIIAVIAVVLLLVIGCVWKLNSDAQVGAKTIILNITTKQQEKEITVHSDAETLSELLKEQRDLQAVIEDGAYGSFLTSLLGEAQNMEQGPWWVYSSQNNKDCLAYGGMCPAMDELHIQDQDSFQFKLTSELY